MTHHGESLRRLVKDDELIDTLKRNYKEADLSIADRAMLDYVMKLTRAPGSVGREDVEALRQHGFDDRAILDIAQITSYFAFVTRMSAGLGVALE